MMYDCVLSILHLKNILNWTEDDDDDDDDDDDEVHVQYLDLQQHAVIIMTSMMERT